MALDVRAGGLTPVDVGFRVVIRRSLSGDGPPYGDVVGTLVRWAEGVLVVETRHGLVQVLARDVHLAKRVPPPPVRR
ncbi:MAG: putative acetyltransferase [Mycobacteriales bacterium]